MSHRLRRVLVFCLGIAMLNLLVWNYPFPGRPPGAAVSARGGMVHVHAGGSSKVLLEAALYSDEAEEGEPGDDEFGVEGILAQAIERDGIKPGLAGTSRAVGSRGPGQGVGRTRGAAKRPEGTQIKGNNAPYCSYDRIQKQLLGPLPVVEDGIPDLELRSLAGSVRKGGLYTPPDCSPRYKMAIVVPYRDRAHQIIPFVYHMHMFLQRQMAHYQIFLVEQADSHAFNRGMLFNIGYETAKKLGDFNCFIFADIDLLPMNDHLMYDCTNSPKHMAAYVDKLKDFYMGKLSKDFNFIGGVVALTDKHYELINGFSNIFFGWGGEDDDLGRRLQARDLSVHRLVKKKHWHTPITQPEKMTVYAHYHALSHTDKSHSEENPYRFVILQDSESRMEMDGLSCLAFRLVSVTDATLYTLIKAEIDRDMVERSWKARLCSIPQPDQPSRHVKNVL